MLDPTPLRDGQVYATVADIRDCNDLPEMPITPGFQGINGVWHPFLTRTDGTPLTLLVRAPSFAERRQIDQAAKGDDHAFALETCLVCIKEPSFTREQLTSILATKHPALIDQIAEQAWALADFPADLVAREVRRLAGLPETPPPEKDADAAPERTDPEVAS